MPYLKILKKDLVAAIFENMHFEHKFAIFCGSPTFLRN